MLWPLQSVFQADSGSESEQIKVIVLCYYYYFYFSCIDSFPPRAGRYDQKNFFSNII